MVHHILVAVVVISLTICGILLVVFGKKRKRALKASPDAALEEMTNLLTYARALAGTLQADSENSVAMIAAYHASRRGDAEILIGIVSLICVSILISLEIGTAYF